MPYPILLVFIVLLGCHGSVLASQNSALEARLLSLEAEVLELRRELERVRLLEEGAALVDEDVEVEAGASGAQQSGGEGRLSIQANTRSPDWSVADRLDAQWSGIRARYFLGRAVLGSKPPEQGALSDGIVALEPMIRLDPASYGLTTSLGRAYSRFRDPVSYRAAGVLLESHFHVPAAGTYVFEIAPKPSREGAGSPVSSVMGVWLELDGVAILDLPEMRSWRGQVVSASLDSGRYDMRLWVVANSPGYAVSPVGSRVEIRVLPPGFAQSQPLSSYLRRTNLR